MGDLPTGWATCKMEGVTQPRAEKVAPQHFASMPFVGMDHVEADSMRIVGRGRAGDMKSQCSRFYPSDVIYGRLRPYLNKVVVPGFDGLASAEFIVFPPTSAVFPQFLAYRLNARDFVSFASHLNEGDRPRVSFDQIGEFNLLLPPLVEQRAIVEKIEALFSELDQGVEQLQAVQQQLKRYRQAVLKAAFEGRLTADWRAQQQDLPTADDLLEQIKAEREARYQQQLEQWQQAVADGEATGGKDAGQKKPRKPAKPRDLPPLTADELADLPDLPEGWTWVYLAALGNLARGKSRHRPRNARHLYGGPYPFIQTGEIKAANRIVREYTQTYSEAGLAQSRMWSAGTLCITIAANIAETAFLGFDGCFPDSVVGFTASQRLVVPDYVEFFIQSAKQRIAAFAPATAQKNINLTTLENLVVPYCSRDEQDVLIDELDARFSVLDKLEQAVEAGLEQAEALRQSILKKAFEGRLLSEAELAAVRAHPDYEPAEQLLERIRAEREQQQSAQKTTKKKTMPMRGRKRKAVSGGSG